MNKYEEIIQALRTCNNPKGHRCSECPVFSRYPYGVCKRTVDRQAADALTELCAEVEWLKKSSKIVDGKQSTSQ